VHPALLLLLLLLLLVLLLQANRDFQISVGTAGPQPRAPELSGHECQIECQNICRIELIEYRIDVRIDQIEFQVAGITRRKYFLRKNDSSYEIIISPGKMVYQLST